MRTPWTGCGTALVTPFARDGAIDVLIVDDDQDIAVPRGVGP